MTTMKEYGLIFEDLSVKVVEVVVNRGMYESFCTTGLINELENELHLFLDKNNYKPIAIIPDTALNGGKFAETKIREATKQEEKEYIFMYQDDDFDRYKCTW